MKKWKNQQKILLLFLEGNMNNFKNWLESTETIHLWLDDERDPTHPYIQKYFGARGNEVWVKNYKEATDALSKGNVASISLDYDLGIKETATGISVAKWIEIKASQNLLPKLIWDVHSSDPFAAEKIARIMQKADQHWNDHEKLAAAPGPKSGGGLNVTAAICARSAAGIFCDASSQPSSNCTPPPTSRSLVWKHDSNSRTAPVMEMLLPTHPPTSKPASRSSPETLAIVSADGVHSAMFADVMLVLGPAAARTT